MDEATLWVLGVATVVSMVVLLLGAASQLRDEIVGQGWVKPDGRLGRMSRRAAMSRANSMLVAIGFTDHDLDGIRSVQDPLSKEARRLSEEIRRRPDHCLIRRMKKWVYQLENPYSYRESDYYLDMMGAFYRREDHEPSLQQIFIAWLEALKDHDILPTFDVLLATKDGNPLLASAVARDAKKSVIVCKGEEDRSLVTRPDSELPHETDFEGLRAFMENERSRGARPNRRYRAIVIDDSCARGSNVISAARRFNRFVADHQPQYPFEPVTDIVVLFRALASVRGDAFALANLRLHALIAVGARELGEIHRGPIEHLLRNTGQFKRDHGSCADSLAIYRD